MSYLKQRGIRSSCDGMETSHALVEDAINNAIHVFFTETNSLLLNRWHWTCQHFLKDGEVWLDLGIIQRAIII